MVIGGSRNSVTLNIKLFEETINGWWLQTTVTKSSVLDAVASLGPPAATFLLLTTSNCKIWRCCCYYCRHYYFLINLFTINLLSMVSWHADNAIPAGNYIFEVNNRNTRTSCEICSKLTIKIPEQCHWHCSGIFIVNFEHTSHLVLVFLLLTLNIKLPAGIMLISIIWQKLIWLNKHYKLLTKFWLSCYIGFLW